VPLAERLDSELLWKVIKNLKLEIFKQVRLCDVHFRGIFDSREISQHFTIGTRLVLPFAAGNIVAAHKASDVLMAFTMPSGNVTRQRCRPNTLLASLLVRQPVSARNDRGRRGSPCRSFR